MFMEHDSVVFCACNSGDIYCRVEVDFFFPMSDEHVLPSLSMTTFLLLKMSMKR